MKLFYIFIIAALTSSRVYSQKDSVANTEDILPSFPSENMYYDYLESDNINYSINLRSRYLSYPEVTPKIFNKFKCNYDNYTAGFITEKDAGEKKLADFYSYYFSYNGEGVLRNLIAGNYILNFGSGLVLSRSFRSAKTSDVFFPLNYNPTKLKPYSSTDENKYFNGAAATLSLNNISLSSFISFLNFDAGLDSSGNINSIPVSGTHISSGENLRKDAGRLISGGIIADYESSYFYTSVLLMHSSFNKGMAKNLAYKKKQSFFSLFYEIPLEENFSLKGESATDFSQNNHSITMNFKLSEYLSAILSYRNYSNGFSSYYGNPFGEEYNNLSAEKGLYSGLRFKLSPIILDAYYDQFTVSSKESKYYGDEFLMYGKLLFTNKTSLKLKYRSHVKENFIRNLISGKTYAFQFITAIDKNFTEEISVQYSKNNLSRGDEGIMFYNDIGLKTESSFHFNFRIILFRTESSTTAIYEYEKDLPGMFTSKMLTGEGIRYYLLAGYSPAEYLVFSIKFSSVSKEELNYNYLNMQVDVSL